MKALVTGGAGFIGKHLVAELLSGGHEVTVLDNLRRARREAIFDGTRFMEGDIRYRETVDEAVGGHDVVFHLAAQSNVMGAVSDFEYSFETNVRGTFNVLRAAAELGVQRVVFASSREVYGEATALPVPESAPLGAKNPYGASKLAAEAYCRAWRTLGLDVSVLRLANVYGPGDSERVIPLWVSLAKEGAPLQLFGGQQVLDFVPVKMTVQAFLRAAEKPATDPINIGSGKGTRLVDLAARIRELTGSRSPVELHPPRDIETVRFVADVSRMCAELGMDAPEDPLIGLDELTR